MNFKTRESLLQDIKTKITLKDPPKELMRDRSAPQISRRWTPKNHLKISKTTQTEVKMVLLIAQRKPSGEPYHPETHFWKLPKNILFLIFHHLVTFMDCSGITKAVNNKEKRKYTEGIGLPNNE